MKFISFHVLFKLEVTSIKRLFWDTQTQAVSDLYCIHIEWRYLPFPVVSRNRTKWGCQLNVAFRCWEAESCRASLQKLIKSRADLPAFDPVQVCQTWAFAFKKSRSINLITSNWMVPAPSCTASPKTVASPLVSPLRLLCPWPQYFLLTAYSFYSTKKRSKWLMSCH